MPVFPADATDLTRLLVVSDLARSVAWYRDVLGAEITGEYGGTSAVIRFVGSWLLLVTGGGPTADKPTVTMAPPADPDLATAELIVAVPDCRAAHAELVGARGHVPRRSGRVRVGDPGVLPRPGRPPLRDHGAPPLRRVGAAAPAPGDADPSRGTPARHEERRPAAGEPPLRTTSTGDQVDGLPERARRGRARCRAAAGARAAPAHVRAVVAGAAVRRRAGLVGAAVRRGGLAGAARPVLGRAAAGRRRRARGGRAGRIRGEGDGRSADDQQPGREHRGGDVAPDAARRGPLGRRRSRRRGPAHRLGRRGERGCFRPRRPASQPRRRALPARGPADRTRSSRTPVSGFPIGESHRVFIGTSAGVGGRQLECRQPTWASPRRGHRSATDATVTAPTATW